jgi:transcriptional regulator with XRE-family HTH domain
MRRVRQITQQQLAELTQVSDVYIGYIEQGKRRCAISTYISIVNALGYTLDDLFAEYLTNRGSILPIDAKALIAEFNDTEKEAIYEIILSLRKMVKNEHTDNNHGHFTTPLKK